MLSRLPTVPGWVYSKWKLAVGKSLPPPSKSPDITEFTNLTFQELPMVWKCVLSCSPEFLFSFNFLLTFWVDFLEFLMLFISLFNFIFIIWVTEVGSLAFSSKLQFSQLFPLKWRSCFSTLQFSTLVELTVQKIVACLLAWSVRKIWVWENGSLDFSDFLHGVRVW